MRYKITIEYDGTDFFGWQRQEKLDSVQGSIEKAIYKFSSENITLYGAGRTDTGVHATGQVAHFDLNKKYKETEIIGAINFHLKPKKACVIDCSIVDEDFHARFSAKKRTYIYKIITRKSPLILDVNRAFRIDKNLDIDLMINTSKYLLGPHDFSAFRASSCQSNSPVKTIDLIDIYNYDNQVHIKITAKSFLHHMVRNITGALVKVGTKQLSPNELNEILKSKDRTAAPATAPACGLYFVKVEY
jgi:tRNA pseudouridine38-40 synthase